MNLQVPILTFTISKFTLIFVLILSGCFTCVGPKFLPDGSTLGLGCLKLPSSSFSNQPTSGTNFI